MPRPNLSHIATELRPLAVPVSSLLPHPANARAHSKRNIDAVAASLKRFGQRSPLIVSPDGVVLAGNARMEAMRLLGWTHAAVVRFSGKEQDALAFSLADNRTAELADWDARALYDALLTADDPGALGWSDEEMRRIFDAFDDSPLDPSGGGEPEPAAPRKWTVSVDFPSEAEQLDLANELRARGLAVRCR